MKARQAAYPGLTLTEMYNVLEKLRGGDLRSPSINGDGTSPPSSRRMAGVIWRSRHKTPRHKTQDARQEELLTRLVALNHERAAEEKRGLIRWLRPEYQRGGDLRSPTPTEETPNLPGTEEPPSQSKINNPQSTILNQQSSISCPAPRPRRPGRRDPETPPRHRRERHGHLRLLRQEIQAPRIPDRRDPGDPALAREAGVRASVFFML